MIKTIIFDIGKVLMGWFPERIYHSYDKEAAANIKRAVFDSDYWDQLDEGIIPVEDLFASMVQLAPDYEKEIYETLESRLDTIAEKKEYAIPWVCELKEKGYQMLFLSNYSEYLRNKVPEVLAFLDYMDGGVFSYEAKLIKPDLAIYQAIIEKYQLDPKTCLFIDDREANIVAAKQAGFHAIQFKSYEETHAVVEGYLDSRK